MAKHRRKEDFLGNYATYDPEHDGYGSSSEWKRNFSKRMSTEEAEDILDNDDPWTVLKVKRNASPSEIKKAFYSMAMYWHPDVSHEPVEKSTKMMQKINAAYSLLSDIGKN